MAAQESPICRPHLRDLQAGRLLGMFGSCPSLLPQAPPEFPEGACFDGVRGSSWEFWSGFGLCPEGIRRGR